MDDLLTTRQLQNLLRVDRITIYRMLKDGRLRGFKVGGQWRFSRTEIEAWLEEQRTRTPHIPAAAPPGEGSLPLSQVLPLSCVRAIQAVCAEAMGIAIVTTDMRGVPLAGVSNTCDFCASIRATRPGQLGCSESWRGQPDGQVRACHAGLLCASLPISVGGQPVALTAACQFVAPDRENARPEHVSGLPELAARLNLPMAHLQAVVDAVHLVTQERLVRVPRLVQLLAETVSEMGQERLHLLGRLEKIAEMSRI